jgi:hypothetical protein
MKMLEKEREGRGREGEGGEGGRWPRKKGGGDILKTGFENIKTDDEEKVKQVETFFSLSVDFALSGLESSKSELKVFLDQNLRCGIICDKLVRFWNTEKVFLSIKSYQILRFGCAKKL